MGIILMAGAGVLLGVGIGLLLLGRRGRPIDDHPLCRGCRFDLVGVPGIPSAGGRCPECGAGLADARRLRIGNRRPSRGLIRTGAVLALLAVVIGGTTGFATARGVNWQSHKPLVLLRMEARGTGAYSSGAWNEVVRRIDAGRVGAAGVRWWIGEALERQADPALAWNPSWGELVEASKAKGFVEEKDWLRYASQAVILRLKPRDPVRVGDRVPFSLPCEYRVGNRGRLRCRMGVMPPTVDGVAGGFAEGASPSAPSRNIPFPGAIHSLESGQLFPTPTTFDWHISMPDEPQEGVRRAYNLKIPATTRLGTNAIKVAVKMQLLENPPGLPPNARPSDLNVLIEKTVELEASFQCVEEDAAPIRMVTDPAAKASLETGLTLEKIQRHGAGMEGYTYLVTTIRHGGVNANLALDAYLRVDGREVLIGRHAWEEMPHRVSIGFSRSVPDSELPSGAKMDLILRPSPAAARLHPNMWEIYGGDVVIEDVKIE